MEEEVIKGTFRRKVQFYAFLFMLLILVVILKSDWFVQFFSINTNGITAEQLKLRMVKEANNSILYSALFLAFNLGLAFFSYKLGRRIHLSKQFPPPETKFPFTMKVKRGKKALHQAYAAYFTSALLITHGIAMLAYSIYSASAIKEMVNVI